jgi:hypothetical protein
MATRRKFLARMSIWFIAAPAIVRASSLMSISPVHIWDDLACMAPAERMIFDHPEALRLAYEGGKRFRRQMYTRSGRRPCPLDSLSSKTSLPMAWRALRRYKIDHKRSTG